MADDVGIAGFSSYVRTDDDAEGGRIADLGRDVVHQYELLTGQSIDLFLDRDSLSWGERWRQAIDSGVKNSAFFVPVLTPKYFQRAECRNELQTFATSARALGVNELVLPVKYVEFPELNDSDSDDPLIRLVKEFQWVNWSDTRFADRDSEQYRRAVGSMAEQLAEVNRVLDHEAAVTTAGSSLRVDDEGGDDETPGSLDLMETAERVLPLWTQTIGDLGGEMTAVSEVFAEATEKVERQERRGGSTFAGRVAVARETARDLFPHAERIRELGRGYAAQMHDVDAGVQAMLRSVAANPPTEDSDIESICGFLESMRLLASQLREGLTKMEGMLEASESVAKLSRDLRAPLTVMREGLTAMREGQAVADIWDDLISRTKIDCETAHDDST